MNILIKQAKIVDSSYQSTSQILHDIRIENGFIVEMATNIDVKKEDTVVALDNLHVSSGWFDSSVSFGEPGYEERETLKNGLLTAAKSGFTKVAINPNTNPVLDTNATISFLTSKALTNAVDILPIGALTSKGAGIDLAELFDMKNAGAVAFGDYQKSITNPNLLKIALQYTQSFDGLVLSFPQENQIAGKGIVNEGINATHLGLKGAAALAEELQVARDLFILEYTGGKLHIPTISTERSVALIQKAKQKNLDVSCSVAIHNLFFNDDELKTFDTNYKLIPPLRTRNDNKALIKGVKDGTIDFVTSDHNPIDIEHKKVEFDHALSGTIGLESFFGALHTLFDLDKTIDLLTSNGNRFGASSYAIQVGEKANLSLFNPDSNHTFNEENILSTSKNAAFLGASLKGKAYGIVANNQLILND